MPDAFYWRRVPWGSGRDTATSGTGGLVQGYGCIAFLEAYETTGSANAGFQLFDGYSSNGQVILDWTLNGGQSTDDWFPLHQMPYASGIYLSNTSGSVAGSLVVWDGHDCNEFVRAKAELEAYHAAELLARLAITGNG